MANYMDDQNLQTDKRKNPNTARNLSAEARSKGGQNSPGNFKNDPQRAAEAGRKGGSSSRH